MVIDTLKTLRLSTPHYEYVFANLEASAKINTYEYISLSIILLKLQNFRKKSPDIPRKKLDNIYILRHPQRHSNPATNQSHRPQGVHMRSPSSTRLGLAGTHKLGSTIQIHNLCGLKIVFTDSKS